MNKNKTDTLREWIHGSGHIVFFGGAGVSTESGIPDFRSEAGIYRNKYPYPAETMLSHRFYMQHTAEFYDFYKNVMLYPTAQPNAAHRVLAQWEGEGRLKAVVTQNIDGLHQAAGSCNVLELHGSVHRNFCMRCGKHYPLAHILQSESIPKCTCGGTVKPDVVLYEESLNGETISAAVEQLRGADMLIVGGTSLAVYPAAGLIEYYKGNKLVLINLGATLYDARADLVIAGKIGEVLSAI